VRLCQYKDNSSPDYPCSRRSGQGPITAAKSWPIGAPMIQLIWEVIQRSVGGVICRTLHVCTSWSVNPSLRYSAGLQGCRNLQVSGGDIHTCAIDPSGQLHCFGRNEDGECNVPDGLRVVVHGLEKYVLISEEIFSPRRSPTPHDHSHKPWPRTIDGA